jgi:biotin synthase
LAPEPAAINVSAGTAAVLGLNPIVMDVAPTTAYLMLGGRCAMNCAFCAQARESAASALNLSRITWPAYPLEDVAGRIAAAYRRGDLRRACLQATVAGDIHAQALAAVKAIHAHCDIPFDVAILPANLAQVRELVEAGVDHIGFGLDAACQRVFERIKTGNWARSLDMIEQTARTYPGRAAVHLIVGLGETEREMVEMIWQMRQWGVTVGLFAFTPVRGTAMEDQSPPALSHYRRMQAARQLISAGRAGLSDFAFDAAGQLTDIRLPDWRAILSDGRAFETAGCPDCNRPYYNERPGGTMFNYARPLTPAETGRSMDDLLLP